MIYHIFREANDIATWLTPFGHFISLSIIWSSNPSPSFSSALFIDNLNRTIKRIIASSNYVSKKNNFEFSIRFFKKYQSIQLICEGKPSQQTYFGFVSLGRCRDRKNSSSGQFEFRQIGYRTKTSYPNPVRIIKRTFWPDPDPNPNVRYPDPVVRMSEYVM